MDAALDVCWTGKIKEVGPAGKIASRRGAEILTQAD